MLLVIMTVAMMATTNRLAQLINKLNKSWRKDAKKAVKYLMRLLAKGVKTEATIAKVQQRYPNLSTLPELQPALVEAAAYAYGIVPSVLTTAQVKLMGEQLASKWDESGMTLSEKLHGVGVKMRDAIVSTLQEQMRRNKTWTEAARALYDGYGDDGQNVYNGGKDIISRQDLPKYLQKVREATGNDLQALAEQRQAIDKINRLAKNGAPNKALQAAYNELLEAVQKGNEKAIEKAVEVAVNEKSRYVAERITRTEMARAWADGFIAKIKDDADIVAVKFKLSSRHPVFDICDMYAKADMYGLGAGIYPKDKLPPLPVHPHCLCRYVEVIEGEVDMQQQRDQAREAGDKWLNSLPESRRAQVLGRKGLKAWEDGEDWRKYMRGYAGLREAENRLSGIKNQLHAGKKSNEELMAENLVPPTDEFIESIAKKYGMTYTKGKKGEDRFYSDDGKPIYPPNNGAIGKEEKTVLPKGTVISRYGSNRGKYTSPDGTSLGERSLDKKTRYDNELHRFKLTEEFECIEGVVAPWFDQVGRGIQYKFSKSIEQLIKEGVLIEI
ncbi:glycohydrolase toxin TNT-related protein [Phascolarctobacterium succinatutens]|uniref:glycohydrolase toxin TNT-related protein n=1 Tax=Phascolarctobacterium succinatutens TaxID=626940 RepID=UPI0026F22096|nr:glycohydrolase toxin TNT-related protein [Phascolarctobacterium succinatutens]